MSLYKEKKVKSASKEHKCDYCGMKIGKGTSYINIVWCDDGELITSKYHIECRKHCEDFTEEGELIFKENRSECVEYCRKTQSKEFVDEMHNNLFKDGYLTDVSITAYNIMKEVS